MARVEAKRHEEACSLTILGDAVDIDTDTDTDFDTDFDIAFDIDFDIDIDFDFDIDFDTDFDIVIDFEGRGGQALSLTSTRQSSSARP